MTIDCNSVQRRLDWVDIAKGIGILLVIYGHVQQGIYLSGMDARYFMHAENIIYSFHMQLFFFLSGIFVERSMSKGTDVLIWDKVKVILYPYFLWSLLHGSIQVILSPYTNDKLTGNALLQIAYKPIAHFWFLQALFLSYIIYAVLRTFLPISILFIVALAMYIGKFFVDPSIINDVLRMFVFFVAGSMFALIVHKVRDNINGGALFATIVIFIAFQVTLFYFRLSEYPLAKFIAAFVGIIFVVYLSLYIQDKKTFVIIKRIGFLAMPIYLAHAMGSAGMRIVLSRAFQVHDIALHIIMGCLAGLTFPILLYALMKKLKFPYIFTISKESTLSQSINAR